MSLKWHSIWCSRESYGNECEIEIPKYISKSWPWLPFIWPLLTSGDLKGQNVNVCNTMRYHMNRFWKKCNSRYIFKIWNLFDLFDLWWPLMTSKVKMVWLLIFKGIIIVCKPKIVSLRVFLNLDPHDLYFDLKWPSPISKVKIVYLIFFLVIIWVCLPKITFLDLSIQP